MDISTNIADAAYHQQFQEMNKKQKLAVLNLHDDMNKNYEKDWLIQFVGHPRHREGYTVSDAVAYSQFLIQCSLGNIYFLNLLTDKWAQSNKLLFENKTILEKLNSNFLKIQWVDNDTQVYDGYALLTNMKLFQLGHDDSTCNEVSTNFTTYSGHSFIEIGSVSITKFVANLFNNNCGIRFPYPISCFVENNLQSRAAIFVCTNKFQAQELPEVEKTDRFNYQQLSLF